MSYFSGGGIRGLAYVGCFKALEELADLQLRSCSGCSIGVIMAALLTLGYKADELYDFVLHFEYGFVRSVSFLQAFNNYGLENGQKIHAFLGLMIKKKVNDPYITFAQLFTYARCPIKLIINACCLNTYKCVYFNHITTPDMPVITALRMSIAVPVLIAPVVHEGQYFVDGGIMDNFPMGQAPDSPETLGFSLEVLPEPTNISFNINSVKSYLFHTFGCIYNQLNHRKHSDLQQAHVVHVDIPDVSNLSVDLNEAQRMYVFNIGYDLSYRYLEKLQQSLAVATGTEAETKDSEP